MWRQVLWSCIVCPWRFASCWKGWRWGYLFQLFVLGLGDCLSQSAMGWWVRVVSLGRFLCLVRFGSRINPRLWLTLLKGVVLVGGVLRRSWGWVRLGLHSGLDGIRFLCFGFVMFSDNSIPPQVGWQDVYVQIDNMGGVDDSIHGLTNVTRVNKSWQMATEDGGFIPPAGVQGGSS